MSEKTRKKKDGQDRSKKRQRMRASVASRHAAQGAERPSTDEIDVVTYKKGTAGDRGQRPQTRHGRQ